MLESTTFDYNIMLTFKCYITCKIDIERKYYAENGINVLYILR